MGWGRGKGWEEEECRPARPLLAGAIAFWQGGGVEGGVGGQSDGRGGNGRPGTRKWALEGWVGENCRGKTDRWVPNWWVPGRVTGSSSTSSGRNRGRSSSSRIRGVKEGDMLVGTTSLARAGW